MTFPQISYFLEVARSLNITEAAARLHITQPTLSRQISALESELNMPLFIRGTNFLKLTPAGAVLRDELSRLMADFEEIRQKAERASWGITGTLNIGILDGHDVSGILPDAVEYMERRFPNIRLHLQRFTYSRLLELLYDRKLDVIIDYDFHTRNRPGLVTLPLQTVRPVLALPRRHPLAGRTTIELSRLAAEKLVIVNDEECPEGVALIRDACRNVGGFTPSFFFVKTMADATLWVEAGVRCAIFNTGMSILHNSAIRQVELPQLPPMDVVLGWYQRNENPALPLLIEHFREKSGAER